MMYPELSYIPTQSYFKRVDFFAENIKCRYGHHSVCLISAECHSRLHLYLNSLLDCLGTLAANKRCMVTNADHPN